MKRIFFGFLLVVMMSCNVQAPDNKVAEGQVKARFAEMYDIICYSYNNEDFGFRFDTVFGTTALIADVERKMILQDETDEIYIDYDPWIGAQDFDSLAYRIDSVTLTNPTTAKVYFGMRNFGTWEPRRVVMLYERGNWYIDDLLDAIGEDQWVGFKGL